MQECYFSLRESNVVFCSRKMVDTIKWIRLAYKHLSGLLISVFEELDFNETPLLAAYTYTSMCFRAIVLPGRQTFRILAVRVSFKRRNVWSFMCQQ